MLKKISLIVACFLLTANSYAATGFDFGNCKIELPDSTEAAAIVGEEDAYTKALNRFDLTARIGGSTGSDYVKDAMHNVRNWQPEEQLALKKSFDAIAAFLKNNNIKLNLPASIRLIKTTAAEDFGAEGYTRSNNILLNTNAGPLDVHIVAHELFHVYSRYNAAVRDALYANIGFRKCNPIAYTAALQGRTITNPDCPVAEHYVRLDDKGQQKDFILILYSDKDVQPRASMNDFLKIGLLEVAGPDNAKKPVITNGKPAVYEVTAVEDIFNKVGTNTSYLLHPEEICAEHFAALVSGRKVPQPEYLERMKQVLQR